MIVYEEANELKKFIAKLHNEEIDNQHVENI